MRWHATRSGVYKCINWLWRVTPLLGGAGREAALLAVARNRWLWVSQMYERRHFGAAGIFARPKLLKPIRSLLGKGRQLLYYLRYRVGGQLG